MAVSAAVLAALAGVFIAAQTLIIGAFNRHLHPLVAATWLHLGGLVFGIVLVLVLRLPFDVATVRAHPWGITGGFLGIGIVTTMGAALIGGLSIGTALAIVTGTQLLLAFALDAIGIGGVRIPFDPLRLAGAAAIVGGVLLIFQRGQAG